MAGNRVPPRSLPPMPSQNMFQDEVTIGRSKKKRSKASGALGDGVQDTALKASESREPLTPERRKKKRKKLVDVETSFTNTDHNISSIVQNGSGTDFQPSEEGIARKARRRTKKTRPVEHGFPNDMGVEDEDIIADGQIKIPEHPAFIVPSLTSQPVGKLFVEKNRKFQAADNTGIVKTTEQVDDFLDIKPIWTSMDVSLTVYRAFRMIGLFCSGFLAGYTVWNIVVIYVLAGSQFTSLPKLLEIYKDLSYPSQCFLYFLLAISTVSAFDRIDLASISNAFRGLVTLDSSAVASFLYFIALFLGLSQQMTSDRINFYRPPTQNGSLWAKNTEGQILQPWIVINLVVTLLVGLAWLFLSCRPDLDHSEDSIFVLEEDDYPELGKGLKIPA